MTTQRRSRRGSSRRRSSASKSVRWITSTIVEQLLGVGLTTVVDALGALTLAEKQEIRKVVRVHLYFRASVATANNHIHGRYGLIIANDDAIATGAGALPSPILDSDQSWLVNDFFTTEITQNAYEMRFDVRAQRRLQTGTSLAFIIQSDSASDLSTHWSAGMRLLLEHR